MNDFSDLFLTYSAMTANRKLAQIAEASTWTEAMKEEFQRQRFAALVAEADRKARLRQQQKPLKFICLAIIAAFIIGAMIHG